MIETQSILKALPPERLSSFRRQKEDTFETLLSCYFWNLALTEALYPTLSVLEVTLRNHIHHAAAQAFGDDWFQTDAGILKPIELQKVYEAGSSLKNSRKRVTPDRMVAELSFGFWISLFKGRYEQILWPKLTAAVFAYAPKKEQYRKTLFERLERIKRLRNRAFHHEPLWRGIRYNNRYYSINQLHQEMRTLIRWLNPQIDIHLERTDRLPEIIKKKW